MCTKIVTLLIVILSIAVIANATIATFDDNPLAPNSHWGGAGSGKTGFVSGGVNFYHNDGGYSWNGFAYSNMTDTTTAGYENQFSAYTGKGVNDSVNYAVAALSLDWSSYTILPVSITFSSEAIVAGGYFTNTTYTAMDMLQGSGFSKKFGGENGSDQDWFLLTIIGKDTSGLVTAAVDFYLADYRFENSSDDYIVDSWEYINLSGLGSVKTMEFLLSSSDTGSFGMNTPAYFAMDNLVIPEPAIFVLTGFGVALMSRRRRRV
jgi:hypothetical protein